MAEETKEVVDWTAHRFDVVAVSEEFLGLLKDFPEFSTAKRVEVGGKRIEGPKKIMVAGSMEEVEKNLPAIVSTLADPTHQHIRIVHRSGICRRCVEGSKLCEHLGVSIPSLNRAFDLDISKMAATQ